MFFLSIEIREKNCNDILQCPALWYLVLKTKVHAIMSARGFTSWHSKGSDCGFPLHIKKNERPNLMSTLPLLLYNPFIFDPHYNYT